MALELLGRARGQGYSGGKSALYDLVKALRPERVEPIIRFEGLAGELSQPDFGTLTFGTSTARSGGCTFFDSRLKYSAG